MAGTLRFLCLGGGHIDGLLRINGIPWSGFGIGRKLGDGIVCGFLVISIASISGGCCNFGFADDWVSNSSSMG